MSIRTAKEILQAKQMPCALGLVEEMNKLTDKLETMQIEQQEVVDELTYNQLCYKAYLHMELHESEAFLYKTLCRKLGKDEDKFKFSVIEEQKNAYKKK